jgi:hypothetical protein
MKRVVISLFAASLMVVPGLRAEVQHLSGGQKVQFNETPAAVQQAIRARAGSAEIEDIDRGTLNGRVVYEAAFKHNGQHNELRVAEDGTVVDRIVAGQSIGAGIAAQQTAATAQSGAFDEGFAFDLTSAKKVTWDQVPKNLQTIIREKAGSARIEDIDKGKVGRHDVYQAAYKKNGQHTELRVRSDGQFNEVQGAKIISSSFKDAQGQQAAQNTTATKTQTDTAPVQGRVVQGFDNPLEDVKTISWNEMPQNVQQIVKQRIGSSSVQQVRKGMLGDKTTYQVHYTKNGQNGAIRLAEDGSFVKEILANRVIYERAGSQK